MKHLQTYESFKNIKKDYIGQCDTLRKISQENEYKWIDMMRDKKKISFNKFIKNINADKFLDIGESMKEYITNALLEDSTTQTYLSHWGEIECMFLQTCGFEFIFV